MAHWSWHLSPVSVVLSGWESLTPLGWDTNPSQNSSQQMLVLTYCTYPRRMESWVGLDGKEGRTNIWISAEPGSNWGPCGQKAEILPTAPTMPVFLNIRVWPNYFVALYSLLLNLLFFSLNFFLFLKQKKQTSRKHIFKQYPSNVFATT